MRALLALVTLAAATLAAPSLAQDTDMPGCIQANPCEVVVALGPEGIVDVSPSLFTSGDWVLLDVFNGDEVNHTLTVVGLGVQVTVLPDDIQATRPFELPSPGTVTLRDAPTNDTAGLTVESEESFTGSETGGRGTPGLAPVALLAGLVAGAAVLRRRA